MCCVIRFLLYFVWAAGLTAFLSSFLPRDATQSAVMRLHVVCLSVRDVQVRFYSLKYFENNVTAKQLKVAAQTDPNMGIWCNGNTPKLGWNRNGVRSTKTCKISETVQDTTKK